jgi:hypothetical protein
MQLLHLTIIKHFNIVISHMTIIPLCLQIGLMCQLSTYLTIQMIRPSAPHMLFLFFYLACECFIIHINIFAEPVNFILFLFFMK